MYTLVVPVHNDECIVTRAKCIRLNGREGYEMRVYQDSKPFSIELYKIDSSAGTTSYIKSMNGVRRNRKD